MRSYTCALLYVIFHLYPVLNAAETEPATFDQRQSGHYNIHISIKDVAIIDLEGNDFTDKKPGPEDYYYDDNDFTIKPLGSLLSQRPITTQSSTTSSPGITPPTIIQSASSTAPLPIVPSAPLNSTLPLNNSNSNIYSVQQFADEVPKPMPTKKPSVVIIDTDAPTKPTKPHYYHSTAGGLIPVQIITDPQLRQQPMSIPRYALRARDESKSRISARTDLNSKHSNRSCRRGQLMDPKGNCRSRRSSLM